MAQAVPNYRGLGSIPGQFMCNSVVVKVAVGKFLSKYFGFDPPVRFDQRFIPIPYSPTYIILTNDRTHSFYWHVQNSTIPCHSQELRPFLSVIYFFLPPFSTNYLSIFPHFNLPSISWSTSQSSCFQIHVLRILFSSILCTCSTNKKERKYSDFNFEIITSERVWTESRHTQQNSQTTKMWCRPSHVVWAPLSPACKMPDMFNKPPLILFHTSPLYHATNSHKFDPNKSVTTV
jgi:hypothetical protein